MLVVGMLPGSKTRGLGTSTGSARGARGWGGTHTNKRGGQTEKRQDNVVLYGSKNIWVKKILGHKNFGSKDKEIFGRKKFGQKIWIRFFFV